jgi:hypothetical protein
MISKHSHPCLPLSPIALLPSQISTASSSGHREVDSPQHHAAHLAFWNLALRHFVVTQFVLGWPLPRGSSRHLVPRPSIVRTKPHFLPDPQRSGLMRDELLALDVRAVSRLEVNDIDEAVIPIGRELRSRIKEV